MENNIFKFGTEHFKQFLGTAMGTPAACIYATLYYRVHENTLLTKYKDDIILLKRFIDDMFGIWTSTEERFEQFKADLPFGLLTWEATSLKKSVDFLDLTITLENDGTLSMKTFQKKMNLYLYLYIPVELAHPPVMIIGVINSLVTRFHNQNTHRKDFIQAIKLLF
ncbi:hypothetical protein ACHAXS_000817 [Conticribra weissflogii]